MTAYKRVMGIVIAVEALIDCNTKLRSIGKRFSRGILIPKVKLTMSSIQTRRF